MLNDKRAGFHLLWGTHLVIVLVLISVGFNYISVNKSKI